MSSGSKSTRFRMRKVVNICAVASVQILTLAESRLHIAALYHPEFLTSALRTLYETSILGLRDVGLLRFLGGVSVYIYIYKHPCADHGFTSYRSCQYTCGFLVPPSHSPKCSSCCTVCSVWLSLPMPPQSSMTGQRIRQSL